MAVHDATVTVAEGDACAITGPNGNGKSSILMGVTGMVRRRGTVEIFGAPAPNGDVRWAARNGLTLVPERRQLYPDLSAADTSSSAVTPGRGVLAGRDGPLRSDEPLIFSPS